MLTNGWVIGWMFGPATCITGRTLGFFLTVSPLYTWCKFPLPERNWAGFLYALLVLNGIMTFLRKTLQYPERCSWKHDMSSMFGRRVRAGYPILAGRQESSNSDREADPWFLY